MKRVVDLKPADLERVAVWQYDGEFDDVAHVRATDRCDISDADEQLFVARTQFVLATGAQHTGFCSPGDDSGLDYLQPVIVTNDGPVFFWFDEPPSRESLDAQWRRLGAPRESIFPIHFRCLVPFAGRFVIGTIDEDDLIGVA